MSTNDSVGPNPGEANCLPRPDAEQLVFNCVPFAPPNTTDKVGDIFPDPVAQRAFRNCVKGNARAKGIDPNTIECGADSTLEDKPGTSDSASVISAAPARLILRASQRLAAT